MQRTANMCSVHICFQRLDGFRQMSAHDEFSGAPKVSLLDRAVMTIGLDRLRRTAAPRAIGLCATVRIAAQRVETFLQEYNPRMLQILTIHEAYPGHYVQLEYSNRHPSLVRKILSSGVFAEGWAVYTEQMMLEDRKSVV